MALPAYEDPDRFEDERTLLPPGSYVDAYVLESMLGSGGFGVVYAARHRVSCQAVAIKILDLCYSQDQTTVRRFELEARAAQRVEHPNIVRVISFGTLADGRRYMVMERLRGQPLSGRLRVPSSLSITDSMAILEAIAAALSAVHEAGIVHRDLKPANVFLAQTEDGCEQVKLLDFGVAKLLNEAEAAHLTRSGIAIGTPSYMAPEQCAGRPNDHRCDIYAFGVLAFVMLTGQTLFDGENALEVMGMHMFSPPPMPHRVRPELPELSSQCILWMLNKDRDQRPATMELGFRALQNAMEGIAHPALPSGPADTTPGRPRAMAEQARPAQTHSKWWIRHLWTAMAWSVAMVVLGTVGLDHPKFETEPVKATPLAPALVTASTSASVSSKVSIEVRGLPEGTAIVDEHGAHLGHAPGTLSMVRSNRTRKLQFRKRGYVPKRLEVVPDKNQALYIELERPRKEKASEHTFRAKNALSTWDE